MATASGPPYQVQELARLAGVSVRMLHHYDRLGLLRPGARTEAGYRLYDERDLARLQHIVTLKLIGFPLKQIARVLERGADDLLGTLRIQRRILQEKGRRLDLAVQTIARAEARLERGEGLDWDVLTTILEVMTMANEWEFARQYYTEEQLQELGKRWSPELQERVDREWAELIHDVEAVLDADPAGEVARALAARWSALVGEFTGGNPAITENLKRLYADQANWPAGVQKPYSADVEAFIAKAMAGQA